VITKLVAQPNGGREVRTVVGAAFGSDKVNEQVALVQAGVVNAVGLGHLANIVLNGGDVTRRP
jgi:phosphate/sulfate permease